MPSLVLAWLAGEGLIIYRSYKKDHRPPMPGQLLAASGVFLVLGVMAQNQKLTTLAGLLGWGFDIAAFMNVAPDILTGATKAEAKAQPGASKGTKITNAKGQPA